ncbi:unnamed protein product [Rotaria magnacalcarata]|nr:unnamed protein product [Rotaria magnacalcarata]CAF2106299.1 unnamed protein product [Rotaria magnacalcarata]CAF2113972.1 unnamed protein product [Rotaria magnacalcarata]CAF2148617.1 unnamed protein product [Rotaria magnacalcarata]CAF3827917.1 unnamed protein product [Rotaria magnacalcarata]
MTSLTSKLEEITKRLQHLTVWRPSERDPFLELDCWRTDAHAKIEHIFNKKKQQIQQLIEKHEREFMRQLARQRSLLNSIHQKLSAKKEISTRNQIQNDTSIFNDLQSIENDINTRLGRGEMLIEITPLDLDNSVTVSLKTYLSTTSSMYIKETSTINQPVKPKHRSADEIAHGLSRWLQVKQVKESATLKELEDTKQKKRNHEENSLMRKRQCDDAYTKWLNGKSEPIKKKSNLNDSGVKRETTET